jgi:hypothetical protein
VLVLQIYLFNLSIVLKMKKIILSALFVTAFSMGLFAKGSVEVPAITKAALEVSTTIEAIDCFEEEVNAPLVTVCTNTYIPVCSGSETVYYFPATVCAANQEALNNLISSFQCSPNTGGGNGNQQ